MQFNFALGRCPFCAQTFKSAGALSNHLSNRHLGSTLPSKSMKCKRPPCETDSNVERDIEDLESSSATMQASYLLQEYKADLRRIFSTFALSEVGSQLSDMQPKGTIPNDQREIVSYEDVDDDLTTSDTRTPNESIELFPTDRGAGKALATRPFLIPQISKLFVSFENALGYKLA